MVEKDREVLYRKNSPRYGGQVSSMLFDTLFPQGHRGTELFVLRGKNMELLGELFKRLNLVDLRRNDDKESIHGLLGAIGEQVVSIEEV